MTSDKKIILLALLLLAGILLAELGRKSQNTAESKSSAVSLSSPSSSAAPAKPVVKLSGSALETQKQEFLKCFPKVNLSRGDVSDPGTLLPEIFDSLGKKKESIPLWENTHISLPNGEKRRVHVFSEIDKNGKNFRKLQFFGVDAEDLPVPLDIPKSDVMNPSEDTIQKYKSMGETTYTETATKELFENGAGATVDIQNGRLHELDISGLQNSFYCEAGASGAVTCKCNL